MEELKSKKMGDMPIGKLLAVMSLPAILSMLVQALYNVVDSIFVARLGEDALEALAVAYPMQMLVVAFAVGIGIGTNAQIARRLGEGRQAEADKTAKTGLFLALVCSLGFLAIGLLFSRVFVSAFATNANVLEMGTEYLLIVVAFSFGSIIEITCSKCLQATGNMKLPMISQLIGALTNVVLDPIMIFGLLGFPAMGVRGAAIATVIGQVVAMLFILLMFKLKKHDVNIWLKGFKPEKSYIWDICRIGIPTMVMNAITSVTTTVMNIILRGFDSAMTILGLYFKLQSFVFMPVFGLMQGALPILGYNYGAKDKKRYLHALKLTFMVALFIMVAGTLLFQFGSGFLLSLFNATGELLTTGIYALRIISICFVFAALGIGMTTLFQSLGYGLASLVMSLLRQIVFILPLAWGLSIWLGSKGVWFCYPIAEILNVSIFIPIAIHAVRKEFKDQNMPMDTTDSALVLANAPLGSVNPADVVESKDK